MSKAIYLIFTSFFISTLYGNVGVEEALNSSYLYDSVNVITGEYWETQTDLVDPFPVKRCFQSGWHFNKADLLKEEENVVRIGDNDFVEYTYHKDDSSRGESSILIDEVKCSDGREFRYTYVNHPTERKKLIGKREELGGRYQITEYYDRESFRDQTVGKVKLQKGPVGHDETPIITSQYFYQRGYTEVLDALGHQTNYHYGTKEKMTAIENFIGGAVYRVERFYWDENELLIGKSLEDGNGTIHRYESFNYDLYGNVSKHTLYGNLTGGCEAALILQENGTVLENGIEHFSTLFRYDGKIAFYQNEAGSGISYFYDEEGDKLIKKLTYDHQEIKIRELFEYDEEGNLLYSTIDNGFSGAVKSAIPEEPEETYADQSTSLQYDFANRLIRIESDEGSTSFKYDYNGNQIASSDTYGNKTTYVYDDLGRLIQTTLPPVLDENETVIQPITRYEYDIFDQLTATIDPLGGVTKTLYNVRGKPTEVSYPDGTRELFEYNLDGSLRKSVAKNGTSTVYQRDFLSRITKCELFSRDGQSLQSTQHTYDSILKLSTIDASGVESRFKYDEEGRLIFVERGNKRVENLYDATGELYGEKAWYGENDEEYTLLIHDQDALHIEDATGKVYKKQTFKDEKEAESCEISSQAENLLGQTVLVKIVNNEDSFTTLVTYDALGRVDQVERINPFGETVSQIEYRYDAAGNKVRESHSTPSENFLKKWSYTASGEILSVYEDGETTVCEYNQFGELETLHKPNGTTLSYTYDALGNISRLTSSDLTVDYSYTYDVNGKLISTVDHTHNSVTTRLYDLEGQLIEETLGNGLNFKNRYDLRGRRTGLTLPDRSGVAYNYDPAYLKSIDRVSPENNILYTHRYSEYDLEGKLISQEMIGDIGTCSLSFNEESRLQSITTPFWSEELQYDSKGNVISCTFQDPSGTTQDEFEYDSLNQLVQEDAPLNQECRYDRNGNLIVKGIKSLSYDALDRLISVSENEMRVEYQYDPMGRRLSKTLHKNGVTETFKFLYDGDHEIGMVDEQENLIELRILGMGRGADIGATIALELGQKIYAPIHDHRGSICCLVDSATAQVASHSRYSAYGIEEQVGLIQSPWGFSSKRLDRETGLIFFGKRYYAPDLTQWITKDPLGTPDGPNRYTYVRNNPLSNIDLYGHFSLSDIWNSLSSLGTSLYHTFSNIRNHLSFSEYARPIFDKVAQAIIGRAPLHLAGFYNDQSQAGVHGKGELNDKVRITLINGILNARIDYKSSIDFISEAHGGNNIHFIFDSTSGWTWDIFKAVAAKFGYVSPQAHQLAETWKELIAEMGGTEEGGLIIHYAHSVGGTHTNAALSLLTPEEKKMLRIITFGSATLSSNHGTESTTNFVSVRDGIPYLDPIGYFKALTGLSSHVTFVGSWLGVPFVDHMLTSTTYSDLIAHLGQHFVEQYVMY